VKSERFQMAAQARHHTDQAHAAIKADPNGRDSLSFAAWHHEQAADYHAALGNADKAARSMATSVSLRREIGTGSRADLVKLQSLRDNTWGARWRDRREKGAPGAKGDSESLHADAAVAHIDAAHAHEENGDNARAGYHHKMAQGHAVIAAKGGAWSEADHPRDENGRFT
jgi:hypothetical protein